MTVFTLRSLLFAVLLSTCSAAGDYYKSCFQANILGTSDLFLVLEANCHTEPMGPPWICTQLDLNYCYGNDNGALVERDSGMLGKTCDNCQLDGSIFSCDCQSSGDGNGGKMRSSIDTNDLIVNQNGWLRCFSHASDKCPPDMLTRKQPLDS